MTIINTNSISGINSITAQGASGVEFFDSSGNSVQTINSDGLTVGTGATIGGSTNTITASTNGSERLRIDSAGKIGINNSSPLYAMHFKNAMETNSPSFVHMEVTGTNAAGGGGGIAFDTSASNTESGLYLATIKGVRNGENNGSNDLVFSTSRGGVLGDDGNAHSPKEKLRITSTGKLLLPTNSPGIQFGSPDDPAASGGIDIESQTLDDYEEGTWTPTSETGTIDYTSNKYTKIGNIVHLNVYINNWSNITSDAVIQIQSLPFAGENTDANVGSVMYRYIDDTDGVGGDLVAFMSNGNSIRFYFQNSDGDTNYSALKHKDLFSATLSSFRIQMTYRAA